MRNLQARLRKNQSVGHQLQSGGSPQDFLISLVVARGVKAHDPREFIAAIVAKEETEPLEPALRDLIVQRRQVGAANIGDLMASLKSLAPRSVRSRRYTKISSLFVERRACQP